MTRWFFAPLVVLSMVSCGGEGIAAEPLIGGNVTASYAGTDFVPVNGFATMGRTSYLIALGTGPIGCGTEDAPNPPSGYSVGIAVADLTPGTYPNTLVSIYKNVGGFESMGSNSGTLVITSVTNDSVAGTISYTYTNANNETFTANGSFEVVHCAY